MPEELPRLYLITARQLTQNQEEFLHRIEAALAAGVRLVQMREKDLSAAELFQLGQKLRKLTQAYQARLLINDRIDLALALDADGVHLSESSLPVDKARQLIGGHRLIAVSTHRKDQILQAASAGADFVTFSPIFATPSKLSFGPPQGLAELKLACQAAPLPVFALGGITADRVTGCQQAGAFGVAVISAILADRNPATATEKFLYHF